MAYIQRSIPPPNKPITFSMTNFCGGLNNKSEQDIQSNQASELMNIRFADNTAIENRYGSKYYDDLQLDGEVVWIDEFKPYDDVNVLIRATDDNIYVDNSILSDINGKPNGVNHQGKYFFADGSKLWVYGYFAQVTSTYENVIGTPINDYVLMEIVSPDISAVRLGTAYTQGVLNIDYNNYQIYYVPCENEFQDYYSGANVVPSNPKYIVSRAGRLYVAGNTEDDDMIYITDLLHPWYFPVCLPIQLPPNSDVITSLVVYDNATLIGRKEDIHVITGNTMMTDAGTEIFQLRKLNSHTGIVNNDVVKVAHNYLFFLGNDGNCYALSNTRVDESTLATILISKNIDMAKPPLNLLNHEIELATSYFFENEWYVSISDVVLVYNYPLQAWTVYNQLDATSFYVKDRELLWGSKDGRIKMFDKFNFLDVDKPYKSYWYSKRFDMDNANNYKQFREYFLVANTFDDYPSDIDITFEVDYADVSDKFTIVNKKSIWGVSRFGDRFITRNINESVPFVIGRRGRSIRFKLSCGYFVDGEVDTYTDLISYRGRTNNMLVYVVDEDAYYLYYDRDWTKFELEDLNQRMRIYQINGDYELRGKR